MTLECAVGADVGAGVGDGIVGDRVGDFAGAVMFNCKFGDRLETSGRRAPADIRQKLGAEVCRMSAGCLLDLCAIAVPFWNHFCAPGRHRCDILAPIW